MSQPSNQSRVLLLDLSGNERAARDWAARHFEDFQSLNKADLKWLSKRAALANVRALSPHTFAIFTGDLNFQSARGAMILFAALSGARQILFGDGRGRLIRRTRAGALLIEGPRLALEFLFGSLLLVPLSWLVTVLSGLALSFRTLWRNIRRQEKRFSADDELAPSQTALYIRATLTSVSEGGMATHVAGFAGGAKALGHGLQFLFSREPGEGDAAAAIQAISPATAFTATRTLFELWNNLTFTAACISWSQKARRGKQDFDFIYQRYSRFNWTGVALSILTGLPLALEYNGSEVWISRRWDPVGHLNLLKRFESLNLRAADRIFTVSEVERQNLIQSGVAADKVITNPNGVDVERFRPHCGGAEIRRALELADQTVVGFLGTFGPWHGAPVLAKAALEVTIPCHFLFIGDGDERAATEETFANAKDRATFVGRIAHDSVAAYLDACDILASPHAASADGSEFFGSPTKLFEYLAMQKPVVASRLGQIADIIVDEKNGLLVEPGEAQMLAQAIERLVSDADLCERLGAAARQTVSDNFTWKHNAARVFEALRKSSGPG